MKFVEVLKKVWAKCVEVFKKAVTATRNFFVKLYKKVFKKQ